MSSDKYQRSCNRNRIYEIEIPLPPIAEQKRIVARVEKLLGKVEEARKLRAQSLEATQNLLPAELHKIFEEGEKKNWKMVKVEDICSIKGGKRLPHGHKLTSGKTNHPYIRVADFILFGVDKKRLKFIKEDTFSQLSRYTISKDDVYVSIAGTIGAIGVITEDLDGANLTENAAKLTSLRNIGQRYLMYMLTSDQVQSQIYNDAIQTTISKLGLFRIARLQFPLPPLAEQKKIVAHLDSLSAKVEELKKLQLQTAADLDALEKSVLHEAFTQT